MQVNRAISVILFVTSVLTGSSTLANDTAISSDPGRVRILKHRSVTMESELIEMRFEGPCLTALEDQDQGMWYVEARYVFRNLSAKSQNVRLGFPEFMCNPEFLGCAGQDPKFQAFETLVRGAPVKTSLQALSNKSELSLSRIWAYSVAFKPKERLEILHRFKVVGWIQIGGGRGMSYLVETGKNWSKPIGLATFRFLVPAYVGEFTRLPDEPWPDKSVSGLNYKSSRYVTHEGRLYLELEYAKKNWVPGTSNVDIGFESGCAGAGIGIETPRWDPKKRAHDLGAPERYCDWNDLKLAYDPRPSSEDTLLASSSDLSVCIQALYALRGKPFKDPYLEAYFYQDNKTPKQPPYPLFNLNPAYTSALVHPKDQAAIALFEKVISKKKNPPAQSLEAKHEPPVKAPAKPASSPGCQGCSTDTPSPIFPARLGISLVLLVLSLRKRFK